MIGIAALTFDPSGAVYITEHDLNLRSTRTRDITRRATRTPTIDGMASLYDAGFSDGDRTIKLALRDGSPHIDALARIVRLYSRVTVSTADGLFIANPNSIRQGGGEWTMTLLVTEAAA